jgi:isoleucyl-tRNA synthetase
MRRILELRGRVNRLMEECRRRAELGASLEARVQISFGQAAEDGALRADLALLTGSAHPEVDNLADWLLVSPCRSAVRPWLIPWPWPARTV